QCLQIVITSADLLDNGFTARVDFLSGESRLLQLCTFLENLMLQLLATGLRFAHGKLNRFKLLSRLSQSSLNSETLIEALFELCSQLLGRVVLLTERCV